MSTVFDVVCLLRTRFILPPVKMLFLRCFQLVPPNCYLKSLEKQPKSCKTDQCTAAQLQHVPIVSQQVRNRNRGFQRPWARLCVAQAGQTSRFWVGTSLQGATSLKRERSRQRELLCRNSYVDAWANSRSYSMPMLLPITST